MNKFISLFLIIIYTCNAQNDSNFDKLYPQSDLVFKYQDDWGKENYRKLIKKFKSSPLSKNQIVFLGNSITAGGEDWSARLDYPNIENRGIGGDTTAGVLARLDEIIYFEPIAVFLLIGINDLWNTSPEIPSTDYIANNIIEIVNNIISKSAKTKVFVQTILPVSKDVYSEKIKTINSLIKKQKKNNYEVIDLHSIFSDEKGLIIDDFTYDGVHLNEKGYEKWSEFIKPIINSIKS